MYAFFYSPVGTVSRYKYFFLMIKAGVVPNPGAVLDMHIPGGCEGYSEVARHIPLEGGRFACIAVILFSLPLEM